MSRSSSRCGSSPTPTSSSASRTASRRPTPATRARERRAGLHRRAPAPAGHPARGADPPRGPRLLGEGDGRGARDDGGIGEQRAAARARARSRSACPSRASRRRCARSTTTSCARSSTATWTPGSAATSTPSSRCSPRTPRSRCRRWRPGTAAATRSPTFLTGWPLSGAWRWRPVRTRANGQPAFAFYSWDDDERALPALRAQRADLRGTQISDVTAFIVRSTQSTEPRTTSAGPEQPARPAAAAGRLRALRPARAPRLSPAYLRSARYRARSANTAWRSSVELLQELLAVDGVGQHSDRVVEAAQRGDAAGLRAAALSVMRDVDAGELKASSEEPRSPTHDRSTPASMASAPKATKKAADGAATTTTCSACETSSTSPTFVRWRRSRARLGPDLAPRAAGPPRGRRTARNAAPTTMTSPIAAASVGSSMPEKTCHISVLTNRTTLNSSSSGMARASRSTAAASCVPTRRPVKPKDPDDAVDDPDVQHDEHEEVDADHHGGARGLSADELRWPRRRGRTRSARRARRRPGSANAGRPRRRLTRTTPPTSAATPATSARPLSHHAPVAVPASTTSTTSTSAKRRSRTRPHVLARRLILDERRQAGAPEAALVRREVQGAGASPTVRTGGGALTARSGSAPPTPRAARPRR